MQSDEVQRAGLSTLREGQALRSTPQKGQSPTEFGIMGGLITCTPPYAIALSRINPSLSADSRQRPAHPVLNLTSPLAKPTYLYYTIRLSPVKRKR